MARYRLRCLDRKLTWTCGRNQFAVAVCQEFLVGYCISSAAGASLPVKIAAMQAANNTDMCKIKQTQSSFLEEFEEDAD